MAEPMLRFSIKDFRAIKSANLVLNGITIVAGENGSGKSTISKLLYHIFKGVSGFDELVNSKLNREVFRILGPALSRLGHELSEIAWDFQDRGIDGKELEVFIWSAFSIENSHSFNIILSFLDFVQEIYQKIINADSETISRLERINFVLRNILADLKADINYKELGSMNFLNLLNALRHHVLLWKERAQQWREQRPLELFEEYLKMHFQENPPSLEQLELYEYGVPIIDMENNRLRLIHSVQNAIYIDTPMVVGIKNASPFDHWNDLNKLLIERVDGFPQILPEVRQFFEREIIRGKVYFNAERLAPQKFVYQRDDGREFNLLECATGLKSFGIIQMLYYNGHLSRNTLLIIDEPEAHLHPQWIVEYARMMVMLNKLVGIKFFIATHNPDMVSAVRYISEKEGIKDKISFYLAEKADSDRYLYTYRDLGTDIDPIFESFNIALERISQYGFPEDEDQEF